MNNSAVPYATKEVIEILGIGDSTLRKWAIALEEHNYNFIRTSQNKRMFSEKDLVVLKQFQLMVQTKNLSISTAAEVIAAKYSNGSADSFPIRTEDEQMTYPPLPYETLVEQVNSTKETVNELKTDIEQLKTLNKELLSRLDERDKYINESLNRRDELLIQSVRESKETRKLLLEQNEEEKKKRKGIFRFFSN
jgi:DNA-binding transcriptional MerR regulator